MTYAELIPYATPGFIMYAVCSIPAGWIADKWSREGMMAIFFIGIGAASMLTAIAQSPLQIGFGLFAIGCFAAIYHPVGLAMVVHGRIKTGVPLAVNGIFGNMGVASAALIRLRLGAAAPPALLALGSRHAERFPTGQGGEALAFLGRVVARCLNRWLDLPNS